MANDDKKTLGKQGKEQTKAKEQKKDKQDQLTVKDMVEALKSLNEENEKIKAQLLRLAADKENMARLHQNEIEEKAKFGNTKMSKEFVEVLENMYRATSLIKEDELKKSQSLKTLYDGILMTRKSFTEALSRNGVERLFPKGKEFNHDLHQAVSQAEDKAYKSGTIIDVLQAGYTIHGRLLKAAMVVVAK